MDIKLDALDLFLLFAVAAFFLGSERIGMTGLAGVFVLWALIRTVIFYVGLSEYKRQQKEKQEEVEQRQLRRLQT